MKWCDEGIYLLASQLVDKCQSQDGAESALQEIENFLDTGAGNKLKELNYLYKEYETILNQELMVILVYWYHSLILVFDSPEQSHGMGDFSNLISILFWLIVLCCEILAFQIGENVYF